MFSLKTTLTLSIFALTCAGSRIAAAQDADRTQPNYRCEAAMMRADAREVACQGRCQKLSDTPNPGQTMSPKAQCLEDCHDRCEGSKKRLNDGPPCSQIPPDADRCAAKLLGALSQLKFCISNCPAEPQDANTECRSRCDQRNTDSAKRIQAMDVCKDGGAPVCMYQ